MFIFFSRAPWGKKLTTYIDIYVYNHVYTHTQRNININSDLRKQQKYVQRLMVVNILNNCWSIWICLIGLLNYEIVFSVVC